jgi:hypothetical protein
MAQRKKRLSGKWAALIIALLLIAAPAAASVITQNFLRADVDAVAACFVKAEGPDATNFSDPMLDPYADLDTTATITSASGVTLLQEQVTVRGYDGDRITYTDVVRYQNNCDYDIQLQLVVEDDPAGNAGLAGDWSDKSMSMYLSLVAGAGSDFSDPLEWDGSPIVINKGDAVPTNGATGIVTVAAGDEVQGAFEIEVDDGATGTTGILRYTAKATAVP